MVMDLEFSSVADDFFVNLSLQTALPLPDSRETILHFCEAVQKQFPSMTNLSRRESGEYTLEGDRESGSYQWVELESNRLSGGYFNPPDVTGAYKMHRWLLERSFYYLGVSGLDVEHLDLLFGFNLDFMGNRDAIVSQALLAGSPLATLVGDVGTQCVECEPSIVIALDEECSRQVRLALETHGSSHQVRTGRYEDQPIGVYLTVREYSRPGEVFDPPKCFARGCETAEDLTCRIMIPQLIQPIAAAIAAAQ